MKPPSLGQILYSFFTDYLVCQKGLRRSSVQSYRDTMSLLLRFVAAEKKKSVSKLDLRDFTLELVLGFLRYLEEVRGNHIRTRNQRRAALHTFFEYVAGREPEMFEVCQRIAAIPTKRSPPPETRFLEQDEIASLFERLPATGRNSLRDRTLLLFLYNTGARVQEVADLRREHLDLGTAPRARLHGKGDKWRTCPLWDETARLLRLLAEDTKRTSADAPVFCSRRGQPLTRFGIYKLVRRYTDKLDGDAVSRRKIGPHVFRHTTAVHLLEAGVEVNVIRGWLGHVDLATTNRYAEISIRTKQAALAACAPPVSSSNRSTRLRWRNDKELLGWLASL